jgi:hypothetical protein
MEVEITELNSKLDSLKNLVDKSTGKPFHDLVEDDYNGLYKAYELIENQYASCERFSGNSINRMNELRDKMNAMENEMMCLIPKRCIPLAPLPEDNMEKDFNVYVNWMHLYFSYLSGLKSAFSKELLKFSICLDELKYTFRQTIRWYTLDLDKEKMWCDCINLRQKIQALELKLKSLMEDE